MAVHLMREGDRVVSEILVDEGLLTGDGARIVVPPGLEPERIAIFAQPGSEAIAGGVAAVCGAAMRILPDREDAKRLAVAEEAYLWLNSLGFTRGDLIVGVGGGAVTDVAGFVAATYLRGVTATMVATTLLGAVDAAIGGKTGVNVGGKNLVGVFRHPQRVVVDTAILAELPVELIREGSAEASKAGWIGDPVLVDLYENHGLDAPLQEVVDRAVAVKTEIVNADFRERESRAWLNFGHTVGHAIEVLAGLSHGEAVAVGMVAAAKVSELRTGFRQADRLVGMLRRLGLPTSVNGLDAASVRNLMALDKKRDRSGLRMVLLRTIGAPEIVVVDDADVTAALAAVGIE